MKNNFNCHIWSIWAIYLSISLLLSIVLLIFSKVGYKDYPFDGFPEVDVKCCPECFSIIK